MGGMPRNSLSDTLCGHYIAIFLSHLEEEGKRKGSQRLCAAAVPGHCGGREVIYPSGVDGSAV